MTKLCIAIAGTVSESTENGLWVFNVGDKIKKPVHVKVIKNE